MEADELRTSLGWVEIAGEEDNLAIMLCTVFDDGGPEDSDTGWSEAAVAGYEKTRDAIHAHYASALAARDARIAALEAERGKLLDALRAIAAEAQRLGVPEVHPPQEYYDEYLECMMMSPGKRTLPGRWRVGR